MAKGRSQSNTAAVAAKLVESVVQQMGLTLWDVCFEKEGASWYLRYFIDREGGVTIQDCEDFSRAIDKLLDEADPIEQSYYLEVSSPGVERELRKDWHFSQYKGSVVNLRLIRPVEGVRDFQGVLTGFDPASGQVTLLLDEETEMTFGLDEAAYVRLNDDFSFSGALDEPDGGKESSR